METELTLVQKKMENTSLTDRLRALRQTNLSTEDLIQGVVRYKFSFLGKVYSSKTYLVTELDKELKKVWPKSKDIHIKREENDSFLIKFQTSDEYDAVNKQKAWHIEGDLFLLAAWNPQIPKSLVDLTKVLLWIRLYNMQPGFPYPNIVESLVSPMGEVKELDPPDCIVPRGKIQKVLVSIDVRDPLRRGFWVNNAAGEEVWIRLFYEKQHNYAYLPHSHQSSRHASIQNI